MHDEVDAEVFHPPRARHAIGGREIVAHHFHAEIPAGVDDAANRGFMRAAHHDDEVCARLGHHLRFEVPAVHGFQVGDDRMLRKLPAQRLHGVQSMGQQQRRARLEPVHAGVHRHGGGLERFIERRHVERNLDDGERQRVEIHDHTSTTS